MTFYTYVPVNHIDKSMKGEIRRQKDHVEAPSRYGTQTVDYLRMNNRINSITEAHTLLSSLVILHHFLSPLIVFLLSLLQEALPVFAYE